MSILGSAYRAEEWSDVLLHLHVIHIWALPSELHPKSSTIILTTTSPHAQLANSHLGRSRLSTERVLVYADRRQLAQFHRFNTPVQSFLPSLEACQP
jgi:hypothetical protein